MNARTTCLLGLLPLVLLHACSADEGEPETVTVFAASSLTEAFTDLEAAFEDANPEVDVRLNVGGSQVLRLQIEHGAAADVFASADPHHMDAIAAEGLVERPTTFAYNELAVIVPLENPAAIEQFTDLSRASRLVVGTENAPVGRYTTSLWDKARVDLGDETVDAVEQRVVSRESNVRLVRAKVELGEADAAVVYRTDAIASDRVRSISIPNHLNVRAAYPIAATTRATPSARRFVAFVLSDEGQAILQRHGFE